MSGVYIADLEDLLTSWKIRPGFVHAQDASALRGPAVMRHLGEAFVAGPRGDLVNARAPQVGA